MRHELHLIPPAPRRPRWPPVLWARWPLALLAFVCAVYGGAITLMFFLAWGGKANDDERLDREGVTAAGTVLTVQPMRITLWGRPAARVSYRFSPRPDDVVEGASLVRAAGYEPGGTVEVQYLPDAAHTNRLRGARINLVDDLSQPLWRWVVLPGFAALLVWFGWVLATRRLLAHGDVALADLEEVRELPWVVPRMLAVRYRFRDHRARQRAGRHWVRARSLLGTRLMAVPPPQQAPVVHSRRRPWHSRVVSAGDFAPAAPNPAAGAGADLPHWLDRT